MKKLSLILMTVMLVMTVACSKKAETVETPAEPQAISVDSLMVVAPTLVDSIVTVEGVCIHTCRHSCSKMFLAGPGTTAPIRVEAGKLRSFQPEVLNSFVTVKGQLHRLTPADTEAEDCEQSSSDYYITAIEYEINE